MVKYYVGVYHKNDTLYVPYEQRTLIKKTLKLKGFCDTSYFLTVGPNATTRHDIVYCGDLFYKFSQLETYIEKMEKYIKAHKLI